MNDKEAIEQLESLIDDRKSFIDPTDKDEDNIFRKDIIAIKTILNLIENQKAEIEKKDKRLNRQFKLLQKRNKEIEKKDKIIESVYREANNVLYFDDNSDYCGALWNILRIINPELEEYPILKYIEEDK